MDSPTKRRGRPPKAPLGPLPPELAEAAQAHAAAQKGQAPLKPVISADGLVVDAPDTLHKLPKPSQSVSVTREVLPPLIPRQPPPEAPKAMTVMKERGYDPITSLIDMLEKDEMTITTKDGTTIAVPLPADLKAKIHMFLAEYGYSKQRPAEASSGNNFFKIVIHKD